MTEIKSACPAHQGSTRGSDSYAWNPVKNQGYCHSCQLSTWLDDEGRLWGRRSKAQKPFLIEDSGQVVEHEEWPSEPLESLSNKQGKTEGMIDYGAMIKASGDHIVATDKLIADIVSRVRAGEYVPMRGITKDTLEHWNVKQYDDKQVYVYPSGGTKTRNLTHKAFFAGDGFKGDELFGMNLFPAGCAKKIVITEGEVDALSAWQMIKSPSFINPVVSLPGATPSAKLWENCRAYLDSFEEIILSVDYDEPGDKLAQKVAEIFPNKVYRMPHFGYKDANDVLVNGMAKEYKNAWFKGYKKVKPENILTDADDFLKLYEDSPDFEYFTTGIEQLDKMMLGICKGYVILIQAESGLGKSLSPDTPVIKADGSIVTALEVSVGDKLLGPNGCVRVVTNVNLQTGPMYQITPVKGDPFKCNEDHILSLRKVGSKEVKNVVLRDYLTWNKTEKAKWKLWRTDEVEFNRYSGVGWGEALSYCVGAYLGDGRAQGPEICMGKKKQPVIDYMMEYGYLQPTRFKFDRGAYYIGFSKNSVLWDQVKDHLSPRRVPDLIKYNTASDRKHFLAGILDTDGSVTVGGAEVTQKSEVFADDICFISRSLGLAAYKKVKVVNGVNYYRVGISGDLTKIPCKRLKFKERKQIKNVLHTGFTVKNIGEGIYRGIALDGDHLFLLGDFTVTHNTEFTRYLEWRCLSTSEYKIAAMHLEETKLRSVLGLVSYHLNDNLTIKKFIDEKGKQEEVKEAISKITESERFILFDYDMQEGHQELVKQVKYLVAALGVDYIVIEPIQDVVTGTASEKESKLSDLITQLSTLAAQMNVGIVVVAHQNNDGGAMYSSMITKRAAFELLLTRDRDSDDPVEKNRTHVVIGRKNRTGLGTGYAGAVDFSLDSYTLKPVEGPKEPKVNHDDF